jgi:hypothetical protein
MLQYLTGLPWQAHALGAIGITVAWWVRPFKNSVPMCVSAAIVLLLGAILASGIPTIGWLLGPMSAEFAAGLALGTVSKGISEKIFDSDKPGSTI